MLRKQPLETFNQNDVLNQRNFEVLSYAISFFNISKIQRKANFRKFLITTDRIPQKRDISLKLMFLKGIATWRVMTI